VDDLIGVVGAGAAFQSGEQLVLANLKFQHRIDAGVAGCERAGYCLRLLKRAWVAVTDEPVSPAIGLAHPISHRSVGQIRWHQVTGVEIVFGRHAEFCPSADTFAKELSSGDVRDRELGGQLVGCVPLPAPGGPIKISSLCFF
jgi:hypothetical protein